MKCTLKRGVLCVVWGSSLEQVQSLSIQDGVIVQNTSTPLTAIVFNLSKEFVHSFLSNFIVFFLLTIILLWL